MKDDREYHFKTLTKFSIPHIEVIIKESLEFTVLVYGWTLANSNSIYQINNRSISH